MTSELPTLRWGVIATGQISSWLVRDLTLSRPDAKARHIIRAIGSSSRQKGEAFVHRHIPATVSPLPAVYGSYEEVYADAEVDIIYVGTPHSFHKQNCLDAINAGKHVLCEKAFAITTNEAREVFAAARAKGVFVMEAMWTRFFPLVQLLQKMLHEEQIIGHVHRVFCDLGLDMDIASLGPESRLKNPALGAGTLLDICIYSLTWGLIALEPATARGSSKNGEIAPTPKLVALQSLSDSIDMATSVLLLYPSGAQGILTSTAMAKTPEVFCRIEGTRGYIVVEGESASRPSAFTIYRKAAGGVPLKDWPGETYTAQNPGCGLFWEADAVATDIAAGRVENAVMPWAETLRVLEMMDEIRRQGGARFAQDSDNDPRGTHAGHAGKFSGAPRRLVRDTLSLVRDMLALVRDMLALVRDMLALVRDMLALVRDMLSTSTPWGSGSGHDLDHQKTQMALYRAECLFAAGGYVIWQTPRRL